MTDEHAPQPEAAGGGTGASPAERPEATPADEPPAGPAPAPPEPPGTEQAAPDAPLAAGPVSAPAAAAPAGPADPAPAAEGRAEAPDPAAATPVGDVAGVDAAEGAADAGAASTRPTDAGASGTPGGSGPPPGEPGQPGWGAAPPPPVPGPAPEGPRWTNPGPLQRSRTDRMLGGVCGGIARSFNIDATLVRLVFVLATLAGGAGVLAYGIAWIVIPEEPAVDPAGPPGPPVPRAPVDWRQLLGLGLVGLGAILVFDRLSFGWGGRFLWPLALIGVGAAVLWLRANDRLGPRTPPPVPPGGGPRPGGPWPGGPGSGGPWPGGPGGGPGTGGTPAPWGPGTGAVGAPPASAPAGPAPGWPTGAAAGAVGATLTGPATGTTTTAPFPVRPGGPGTAVPGGPGAYGPGTATWPAAVPLRPPPPRPRALLGPMTISASLVVAGVLALLDSVGATDLGLVPILAVVLGVWGLGLLVGTFFGRSGGLVALCVILSAVLVGLASLGPLNLRGGVGDRAERPTVETLAGPYELGIGKLELDLRGLDELRGNRAIAASVGIGDLQVTVPRNADVVVDAEVGAGEIRLFGRSVDGVRIVQENVTNDAGTPGDSPVLRLDLAVGIGKLEVRRG